jgi:hypothetical protein
MYFKEDHQESLYWGPRERASEEWGGNRISIILNRGEDRIFIEKQLFLERLLEELLGDCGR